MLKKKQKHLAQIKHVRVHDVHKEVIFLTSHIHFASNNIENKNQS